MLFRSRHRRGQLVEVREEVVRPRRVRDRVQVLRVTDVVAGAKAHRAAELRGYPHVDLRIHIRRLGAAAVTLEIVDEDLGHDRRALVVLEANPRGDVLIASQGRPTARAAIAEYVAQVADGSPGMDPPLIPELFQG